MYTSKFKDLMFQTDRQLPAVTTCFPSIGFILRMDHTKVLALIPQSLPLHLITKRTGATFQIIN